MTRAGYLRWREVLKKFHAQKAGEILRDAGYPQEVIARVKDLVLKKNFPRDAEGRALEDALCLVFLEHQFDELAAKSPEEKMVSVLQKTWKKMTPKAQAAALALPYGEKEKRLIDRRLAEKLNKPSNSRPGTRFKVPEAHRYDARWFIVQMRFVPKRRLCCPRPRNRSGSGALKRSITRTRTTRTRVAAQFLTSLQRFEGCCRGGRYPIW